MDSRVADDRPINRSTNTARIGKKINDDNLVYMDNLSLKIVSPTEVNINHIQNKLRADLQTVLTSAGRKNLARRSVENKQPITYRTFKLLISQLKKPRTKQTLLNSIPQQFAGSMDSLPALVKEDMTNKEIEQLPKNIHVLHRMANCNTLGTHSLPLIKYITTRCMEIDFDSPYETIEEEYKECVQIILSVPIQEFSSDTVNCIAILSGLHEIWESQNPLSWDKITLQPVSQSCLQNSLEHPLLDQQPVSALLLPIKADASADTADESDTDTKPELPHLDEKTISKAIIKQSSDDNSPATPSSEPSTSSKDTPIAEETTEQFSSKPDKTPIKIKSIPESKTHTEGPLSKKKSANQTSSVSSQGARPKEAIARPLCPVMPLQQGIAIHTQQALNRLLLNCCKELRVDYSERKNLVEKFIANPNDHELFEKAKDALNRGFWTRGILYDLLTKAFEVSNNYFFDNRLKALIKDNSLVMGRPPQNLGTKKAYMSSRGRKFVTAKDSHIDYTIRNGVSPIEALDSACRDFSIADQGTIIELVVAKTLKHLWGGQKFNTFFSSDVRPFTLISFEAPNNKHSTLERILEPIIHKDYKDIEYIEGHLYRFSNDIDYGRKDYNAEYSSMFAFCTYANTKTKAKTKAKRKTQTKTEEPRFCMPQLFENTSLPEIDGIMVKLYNKEPYSGKIMNEKSWNILRNERDEEIASKNFSAPPKQTLSENSLERPQFYKDKISYTLYLEKIQKITACLDKIS